jgi:hypothetical protein
MSPTIRLLGPGDASLLDRVAPEVFDNPIDPRRTAEFLADGRHHLAVAFDGDVVVGMSRRSTVSIPTSRPNSGSTRSG